MLRFSYLLVFLFLIHSLNAGQQLVVCIAETTQSTEGTLRLFHREGDKWEPDAESWPVLFGKNGLAWGRGLNAPQEGLQKREGDGRTPMGRFQIYQVLGYESHLPSGSKNWPYHVITDRDAWVDDSTNPEYNHLVTIPPGPLPAWFEKQKMRLNDFAYHWLVVIGHNYPKAVPGAGSAIFFHIRRGEHRPTFGCTAMELERLEQLIRWLDPEKYPEAVELTRADYLRLWKEWKLPEPWLVMSGNFEK